METRTFYLDPINGRKSFNNKCHVNEYDSDGIHYSDLISYTTRVASYNHTNNIMSVYSCETITTASHINSFLKFYGFDSGLTMKQLQNYK